MYSRYKAATIVYERAYVPLLVYKNKNKNKNFIDPQTKMHFKYGATISGKSKTNKKYNCACNIMKDTI